MIRPLKVAGAFSIAAIAALAGCGKAPNDPVLSARVAELTLHVADLEKEKAALQAKIEDLSQTPSLLLTRLHTEVARGSLTDADKTQAQLEQRYPSTLETVTGRKEIDAKRAGIKQAEAEAQRLKALGFRSIVATPTSRNDYISARFGKLRFASKFIFDRYDGSYHYRDADRDAKFALISLTVTASKGVKSPEMPGAALYWANGETLQKLADFSVEFAAWESFDTYLGNYPDSKNDFAKTSTVQFDLGVQIPDETLAKRPLYLVAARYGCMGAGYERFRRPPMYYSGSCAVLAPALSASDFHGPLSNLILVQRQD